MQVFTYALVPEILRPAYMHACVRKKEMERSVSVKEEERTKQKTNQLSTLFAVQAILNLGKFYKPVSKGGAYTSEQGYAPHP